jgi:hypothetical protein
MRRTCLNVILSACERARATYECRISSASLECATIWRLNASYTSGFSSRRRAVSAMKANRFLAYAGEPRRSNACEQARSV